MSSPKILVGIIISLGLVLRYFLINYLPVINDEGSYFYDAYLISKGFIPYEDFLTKSTPNIYLLYFFTSLLGNTIFAGRVMLLFLFVLNGILIYQIAKKMFNSKAALVALAVFSLYPEIAVLTSYSQTQILQMFFGLIFIFYLLSIQKIKPIHSVVLSIIVTVAYITRMTSVVYLGLFIFYLIIQVLDKKNTLKELLSNVVYFFGSLFVINGIFFNILARQIGTRKTLDFFGFEMLSQSTVIEESSHFVFTKAVSFSQNIVDILQFFTNMPLLFVGLILMVSLMLLRIKHLYVFITLILFSWYFYISFTSSNYIYYYKLKTVQHMIEGLAVFMLLGTIIHSYVGNLRQIMNNKKNVYLVPIWLFGLLTLYGVWIKFRTPYFIEFIPVIVLSVGYLYFHWEQEQKRFINFVLIGVLFIAFSFSQVKSFTIFYTGSYFPETVNEVRNVIEQNSDSDDTILTASVIFPFVAERNIIGNISHPYWLGYKDFDQELLKLYMPTLAELENNIMSNPPKLVIMDKTTNETYFKLSNSLLPFVNENYEEIYRNTRANQDPLIIYKLSSQEKK